MFSKVFGAQRALASDAKKRGGAFRRHRSSNIAKKKGGADDNKYKSHKAVIARLREKLQKYRQRLANEAAVNKELGRRVAEYKHKYEQEREALKLMTADCNTWRKFATTLQCSSRSLDGKRNKGTEPVSPVNNTLLRNKMDSNAALSPSTFGTTTQAEERQMSGILASVPFKPEWDSGLAFPKTVVNISPLFENFVICGVPTLEAFESFDAAPGSKISLAKCRSPIAPKVLYGFGNRESMPTSVEDFCFPSGVKPSVVRLTDSATEINHVLFGHSSAFKVGNTHMFKLSGAVEGDPNAPVYGYCLQTHRLLERPSSRSHGPKCVNISVCYCFLSRYPFAKLFFSALEEIVELDKMINAEHWSAIRRGLHEEGSNHTEIGHGKPSKSTTDFLRKLQKTSVPDIGTKLSIIGSDGRHEYIEYKRPGIAEIEVFQGVQEDELSMTKWGGPVLLSALSVDRLVLLLGYALLEQKIVFYSKNVYTASACVLAFESLLRPLKWAGPVIPILPRKVITCVDAPVPVIVGVTSAPRNFLQTRRDVVLVKLDEGTIVLPEGNADGCTSMHLFRFPGCDHLCHKLGELNLEVANIDDDEQFDTDICRGHTKPSKTRVSKAERIFATIRSKISTLTETCKTGSYRNIGADHPHTLYFEKLRRTQMMDHLSQMESEGILLSDDEDDDEATNLKEKPSMLENLEAPASQIKEGVPESFRGSQEVLDDFSSSAGEEGFCEDDEEQCFGAREKKVDHECTDRVLFPSEQSEGQENPVADNGELSGNQQLAADDPSLQKMLPAEEGAGASMYPSEGMDAPAQNIQSPARRARQQPIIWHSNNSDFEGSSDSSSSSSEDDSSGVESDVNPVIRQNRRRFRFSTPERYR